MSDHLSQSNGERDDLPAWVAAWCMRELGSAPAESLLAVEAMSHVLAVRLQDERAVVIKARVDEHGRARRCVAIQRALAADGFPCARPLTDVTAIDDLVVHAEEWRPGGEMMRADDPVAAASSASLLADLMTRLAAIDFSPPLPNPEWVRWDHDGRGLFPPNPRHDARAASMALPHFIEETARRAKLRLNAGAPACVLGHADWEAQNLRWQGAQPYLVHDWDSLVWLPEAAVAGAASGAFASTERPTLAPLESSAVFLDTYEDIRGRKFTQNEREFAWAASIWPALHNARAEVLYGHPLLASTALREQAERRLALAGA